jgi:glycosyltransferase involved in cell wall biosynthesis
MNIRWFSPLDAKKTEIARYTQALLPYLQEAFSLGVVSDATDIYEEFTPETHAWAVNALNIYNIGNSSLHCGIVSQAMEKPGVIILHDVCLLELGIAYAQECLEFDLQEMVINEYGADAGKLFARLYTEKTYEWCGDSQEQYGEFVTSYPLFETFTSDALGIIVHSDYAFKKVKARYSGPVIKLDLPYEAPVDIPNDREFTSPLEVIFCGHAGPNRRLQQFFSAWAKVSQPNFFRLSLYGNIGKVEELLAQAAELGLADFINVVGFVDDEVLDQAIACSHLALNLRNPTMGEASASQLRYWSQGIASVVTDVGWYGELPDNVVLKVSPDSEQEELIYIMENILSGKQGLLDIGAAGRQYLQSHHSVGRYIDSMSRFLPSVVENRFMSSMIDDRLIGVMASMCREVDDAIIFEGTLEKISIIISKLEEFQSNR